ncbi:ATO2 Ammonia transport outward protein 2 [Candida maltosa Xu316]
MSTASSDSNKPSTSHDENHAYHNVQAVAFAGEGDEYVIIGNHKYYRHELMHAFLGTFNPDRYAKYPSNEFGNASALGLGCFALTTFVLGLYYAHAKEIKVTNAVHGLSIFYGGLTMYCAGIWEFFMGNNFAYGSFWLALGCMNVPSFGILAAYEDPVMLENAVGLFLLAWGLYTFMVVLLTFKSTVVFVALFVTLDTGFFVLAGAYMTGSVAAMKAGGIVCVISSCCGFYGMISGITNRYNSYFIVHSVPIPEIKRKSK